jgi:hypothetical protein
MPSGGRTQDRAATETEESAASRASPTHKKSSGGLPYRMEQILALEKILQAK